MMLTEFADMTFDAIEANGFDDFPPTACFPARGEVRKLDGVPVASGLREAVLNWAECLAVPGEEYFVAFKTDATHFTVMRLAPDEIEEAVCEVKAA